RLYALHERLFISSSAAPSPSTQQETRFSAHHSLPPHRHPHHPHHPHHPRTTTTAQHPLKPIILRVVQDPIMLAIHMLVPHNLILSPEVMLLAPEHLGLRMHQPRMSIQLAPARKQHRRVLALAAPEMHIDHVRALRPLGCIAAPAEPALGLGRARVAPGLVARHDAAHARTPGQLHRRRRRGGRGRGRELGELLGARLRVRRDGVEDVGQRRLGAGGLARVRGLVGRRRGLALLAFLLAASAGARGRLGGLVRLVGSGSGSGNGRALQNRDFAGVLVRGVGVGAGGRAGKRDSGGVGGRGDRRAHGPRGRHRAALFRALGQAPALVRPGRERLLLPDARPGRDRRGGRGRLLDGRGCGRGRRRLRHHRRLRPQLGLLVVFRRRHAGHRHRHGAVREHGHPGRLLRVRRLVVRGRAVRVQLRARLEGVAAGAARGQEVQFARVRDHRVAVAEEPVALAAGELVAGGNRARGGPVGGVLGV
ncbi:hypothetical protein EDC01DRAFT_753785, partial [Geopyxis carbonaria]